MIGERIRTYDRGGEYALDYCPHPFRYGGWGLRIYHAQDGSKLLVKYILSYLSRDAAFELSTFFPSLTQYASTRISSSRNESR